MPMGNTLAGFTRICTEALSAEEKDETSALRHFMLLCDSCRRRQRQFLLATELAFQIKNFYTTLAYDDAGLIVSMSSCLWESLSAFAL